MRKPRPFGLVTGMSLRLRARPNRPCLPSAFSWLLHDKDLYFVMQRPPGTLKTRPTSHQHLPRLVPVPVGVRGGGFALREGRLGWDL